MARFNAVTNELVQKLKAVVGDKYATIDEEKLDVYKTDNEGNPYWFHKPEVVVFPKTTEEVAEVVKLANEYVVPITPRAAGTNVSCSAIPVYGGIVLSVERMDSILHIDEDNMYMVCQAGVRTSVVQEEAKKRGLLYAGDPCSATSCLIGGNVATNAGGNKAIKFGSTRNQIYSLKMVSPAGDIVTVGARLEKCTTGYCLEQLICGSEGTLGIVTEVTLKLRPIAPYSFDIVAVFLDESRAFPLPKQILKAGIEPTSVEYMDNKALKLGCNYVKVALPYVDEGACYVVVTVEAFEEEELDKKMEQVSDLCEAAGAAAVLQADDRVWSCRRNFAEACRDVDIMFVTEDFVVPLDQIPVLLKEVPVLEEKHRLYAVTMAHIGDGNLHVCLLNTKGLTPDEWVRTVDAFHQDIFPMIYALGGKISGEHGIGYKKQEEFKQFTQPGEYKMVCAIKRALDPNNIMNPGKIIDLEQENTQVL